MAVSVIIFEDNEVLRSSLVTLMEDTTDYLVIGDYNNVMDVAAIITKKMPDVVIMDIDMPQKDGISAVPVIKEINPDTAIIMYTQFEDEEKLFKSMCAGADGYILKKTSPIKLFDAIDDVRNGGAPMSPSIAKKMLHSFRENNKPLGHQYNLTPREVEILQLLIKGYSIKLIASELFIAFDTARAHLKNIYRKLHVNCGKEAIAKVLADKIVH